MDGEKGLFHTDVTDLDIGSIQGAREGVWECSRGKQDPKSVKNGKKILKLRKNSKASKFLR